MGDLLSPSLRKRDNEILLEIEYESICRKMAEKNAVALVAHSGFCSIVETIVGENVQIV
jgi:hypothetical protein